MAAVSSFVALAVAGLVLQTSENWKHPAIGFGVIFLLAAVARLISTHYLSRMKEPPILESREHGLSVREFLRHERSRTFRRFLIFSGSFQAAAMVAGPFFVVYLLRDLHLTYLQYGLWLAAPILAQLITLREWGRIAGKFRNKKVLAVTGWPSRSFLYCNLCSTNWMVVVAINFLSGMLWPGFLLAFKTMCLMSCRCKIELKEWPSTIPSMHSRRGRALCWEVGLQSSRLRMCFYWEWRFPWCQICPLYFSPQVSCAWLCRSLFSIHSGKLGSSHRSLIDSSSKSCR